MDFAVEERHIHRSVWITPTYYTDFSPIGTGAFGSVWYVLIHQQCYFGAFFAVTMIMGSSLIVFCRLSCST
jgi:hypothetical protein